MPRPRPVGLIGPLPLDRSGIGQGRLSYIHSLTHLDLSLAAYRQQPLKFWALVVDCATRRFQQCTVLPTPHLRLVSELEHKLSSIMSLPQACMIQERSNHELSQTREGSRKLEEIPRSLLRACARTLRCSPSTLSIEIPSRGHCSVNDNKTTTKGHISQARCGCPCIK